MKIVVTGALGYLGSALIPELPAIFPGSKIILLDNLATGQLHALNGLPKKGHYQFIEEDIRTYDFSRLALNSKDAVIHLAGLSRPSDSYDSPKAFESVNFDGAVKIAEACAKTSSAFFFPSTTSVYHQTDGKMIIDTNSHLSPQTPYAASKLKAEKALSRIKGLRYTVVRFGTISGPSPVMSIQTAVNKFCWQASTGQELTVWETALHQIRPYLAIEDALGMIHFLLKKNHFERGTYHAATWHAAVSDVIALIKEKIPSVRVKKLKANAMNKLSYKIDSREIIGLGFEFQGGLKKSAGDVLRLFSKFPKQGFRQA